jgi:hypothetical protein
MRIAINQPNFLPWLGYFELLDRVDRFLVLDDVQVVRRSFMVRNRIRPSGDSAAWLTEGIQQCHQRTLMNTAALSHLEPWWEPLIRRVAFTYRSAPHVDLVLGWLGDNLPPLAGETVAAYNWRLILGLCDLLGLPMEGRFQWSSGFEGQQPLPPEERIIDLCHRAQASAYFGFRNGVELGLYSPEGFRRGGLELWKQTYRHPEYSQGRNQEFIHCLSVVDLLCHVHRDQALEVIRSGRCWERIV